MNEINNKERRRRKKERSKLIFLEIALKVKDKQLQSINQSIRFVYRVSQN